MSTIVIIGILAGIKPIEEAYRARDQSCRLEIKAANGALPPDLLKETLGIRTSQIKRVPAFPNDGSDKISVLLSKVSSHDIKSFVEKVRELDVVSTANVIEKTRA